VFSTELHGHDLFVKVVSNHYCSSCGESFFLLHSYHIEEMN